MKHGNLGAALDQPASLRHTTGAERPVIAGPLNCIEPDAARWHAVIGNYPAVRSLPFNRKRPFGVIDTKLHRAFGRAPYLERTKALHRHGLAAVGRDHARGGKRCQRHNGLGRRRAFGQA